MRKLRCFTIFCICAALLACACSKSEKVAHNANDSKVKEKPLIAVSILPQTWFVDRISGSRARTLTLVGQGQNPHSYEPSPRQTGELAEASAWILSGAEFEISLRPKIASLFPKLKIVDGTEGVTFRLLEEHEEHDDSGGERHSETEIDRHTWLGREPAKILAAHIRDALVQSDPSGADHYNKNYEALVQDIDAEFEILRNDLGSLDGRSVFVYHPSFGYFLDEFGIRQEAVETGGKEPGPRALNRLIALAKEEKPAAIFVQAQFPVNAAKTLANSIGAELVSLDPLAQDWLENIRLMGAALKASAGKPQNNIQ
jgi:zinc transport system substrate-binding protein